MLTMRQLRSMQWTIAFEDDSSGIKIKVFRSTTHENIGIIHQREPGKKLKITYTAFGRKTDSPSRAVDIYNEEEKARMSGGRVLAGSAEQVKENRAKGPVRRR